MAKPIFNLLVVANDLAWDSLQEKVSSVCDFYAPVCTLLPKIVHTQLSPVFSKYPELDPLYVIDRGWFDVNVATPHAIDADFILFICPHYPVATPLGYMSSNNVGPWECTVFVQGERDSTYVQGRFFGNSFELYAVHELSHAFYRIMGKRDDTHVHFPVGQDPYTDDPARVLADFDLSSRSAILSWLASKCIAILVTLSILRKKNVETVADQH